MKKASLKILRTVLALLIAATVITATAVPVFATEANATDRTTDTLTDAPTDSVTAPDPTEDKSADEQMEVADKSTDGLADTDSGGESVFTLLYQTVMNYSAEIFCALACGCSLLLAFVYKKGLLPLISAALGNLGGAVGKLREETEKSLNGSEGVVKEVGEALIRAEECTKLLSDRMTALDSKLLELEKNGSSAKLTECIMRSQIDMLYELFMASGIPQFQKEAVAEKVKAMREAIADADEKNKD